MLDDLKQKYNLEFKADEPLAAYTTFKIGGPAKYFIEVKDKDELKRALLAAKENSLAYFMLGGGSNILISDDGFDGLVIRLISGTCRFETDGSAVCFAGNNWAKFVRDAIGQGFGGLDFSGNIPGTVGGAVRGNAGAYGQGVGDFVAEVLAVDLAASDDFVHLSHADCHFDYRESVFKRQTGLIVAEVAFKLTPSEKSKEELLQAIEAEGQSRCAKQPLKYPSAGCSFKNVVYTDELSAYKDWETHGKIPAARFIEAAGLKGKQIGGAKVSDEHANFIINVDHATASDVIQLISLIKMKVRDQYGVQLEEEIQYVGF
ncbi:TPA: UDP-N-acetylenolpyruvoylglucosamine reductase [Candidatus Falkowbacteria bacterium]|nr:UDP-N-acetylenolpyruvoylglucosamine reductase [Candidatus Falkowbacteria bacterium]